MSRTPRTVVGVRFDQDMGEFQLRCEDCSRSGRAAYWPLTMEFWSPKHGLRRCRACHNVIRARQAKARLDADPERRARANAASRANRRLKNRIYEERRRAAILADPERLARRREMHRLATARYRARLKEAA